MKRVLAITFCLLVPFLLTSCGDDDEGINPALFASWTKVSTNLRDCANPNDNNTTPEVCNDQVCETLTINDNLRYEMTTLIRGQAQVETGQVQVSGTQLNFLPDNSTGNTVYDYSLASGQLTLSTVTLICTEDFVYNN